jgi:hypothetical protein
LQEEVLAQRQAQQAARNAAAANQNPTGNEPGADAIAFLETLNPTLRAQVLADADDSVLQVHFTHQGTDFINFFRFCPKIWQPKQTASVGTTSMNN